MILFCLLITYYCVEIFAYILLHNFTVCSVLFCSGKFLQFLSVVNIHMNVVMYIDSLIWSFKYRNIFKMGQIFAMYKH